jgi:hypothetical protein
LAGLLIGNHNPFFAPLEEDDYFNDKASWYDCTIDHEHLIAVQAFLDGKTFYRPDEKSVHIKQIVTNVATSLADEQDLDNLNIERGKAAAI